MRLRAAPAALLVGAVLCGLAPIWVTARVAKRSAGALDEFDRRIDAMEQLTIRQPDYEAKVTLGGIDHWVRTYCDTAPAGQSCAAWHKQKVQDLIDAYGGER